jgi:hypothetical protein
MTATMVYALSCDRPGCTETIPANEGETTASLRIRVHRVNGWRTIPSLSAGGRTDYCRFHA